MPIEHDVTAAEVRTELNDIPTDVLSTDVIDHHINHAAVIVEEYAAADASQDAINSAVTIVAAHGALTSDDSGWTESVSELDVTEEYDVQGMVNTLEARRAEILALVSPSGSGPSLHAVGDRYPDY